MASPFSRRSLVLMSLWRETFSQVKKANSGTRMATAPRITQGGTSNHIFRLSVFSTERFPEHHDPAMSMKLRRSEVRKLRI